MSQKRVLQMTQVCMRPTRRIGVKCIALVVSGASTRRQGGAKRRNEARERWKKEGMGVEALLER